MPRRTVELSGATGSWVGTGSRPIAAQSWIVSAGKSADCCALLWCCAGQWRWVGRWAGRWCCAVVVRAAVMPRRTVVSRFRA